MFTFITKKRLMEIEKVNENTVSHLNSTHKILVGSHKAACTVQYFKRKFSIVR